MRRVGRLAPNGTAATNRFLPTANATFTACGLCIVFVVTYVFSFDFSSWIGYDLNGYR